MKKLPIGIQTFSKIRTEDYCYIDKTRNLFELVNSGTYFFLSRPRRFGKSLFLDTLREAFLGNKAVFEGYYASIFYCYFTALGLDVRAEDVTNHGQVDLTVFLENNVYVFEFKVIEISEAGSTLAQIKERRYYEKYLKSSGFLNRDNPLSIYLVGVEFSKDNKNITIYEWEKI